MKNKKVNVNIMDNVSILDLVKIHILQPIPGHFEVAFTCIDSSKNLVFDEKTLKEMNYQITERTKEMNANDPKTKMYIEEYVAKLTDSLFKNGLVELVDVTDSVNDPYKDLREKWDRPKLS